MTAYSKAMHDPETIGGTPRATQRPAGITVPARWTSEPAPAPKAIPFVEQAVKGRPDPVRYGDWEAKGIAVDF